MRADFFLDKISKLHSGKYRGGCGCDRILHNFIQNTFLCVGVSSWQIQISICESQKHKKKHPLIVPSHLMLDKPDL